MDATNTHPGDLVSPQRGKRPASASSSGRQRGILRARCDGKLERRHPRRGRREPLAALPLLHGQRRSRRRSHRRPRRAGPQRAKNSLLADLDSIEGLRLWRDAVVALQEERECRDGCLIGSLVGELSERDPRSRQAFAAAFERWHEAIRHGLERMRESGEISAAADSDSLGARHLAGARGWNCLLTQITRSKSRLGQGLDSDDRPHRVGPAPTVSGRGKWRWRCRLQRNAVTPSK